MGDDAQQLIEYTHGACTYRITYDNNQYNNRIVPCVIVCIRSHAQQLNTNTGVLISSEHNHSSTVDIDTISSVIHNTLSVLPVTPPYIMDELVWCCLFIQYSVVIDIEQVSKDDTYPSLHNTINVISYYLIGQLNYSIDDIRVSLSSYINKCISLCDQLQLAYMRASTRPVIDNIMSNSTVDICDSMFQCMLVHNIVHNALINQYRIDTMRCHVFWSTVVRHIEQYNVEVNNVIYEYYTTLTKQVACYDPKRPSHVIEFYTDQHDIHHCIIIRCYPGFHHSISFAQTWPAALCFSDYIMHHTQLFNNQHILGLGSGCGFTEITLAQLTNSSMIATDIDSHVIDNILYNYSVNHCVAESRVSAHQLDWTLIHAQQYTDITVVVTCDTTYSDDLHLPLGNAIKLLLLMNCKLIVYSSQSIRSPDTFQHYLHTFESLGLKSAQIELTGVKQQFEYNIDDIKLHQWSLL